MSDGSLSGLVETIWQQLGRGTADRHHPARHPVLATTGEDGPELRTLVLRKTDRAAGTLTLFTDAVSPKATQIRKDPRVALHIWIPKASLQLRIKAVAELRRGDPSLFDTLPAAAQANYGGHAPGARLEVPDEPAKGDPARFMEILCTLTEIDVLHLTEQPYRALFQQKDEWEGTWIAP